MLTKSIDLMTDEEKEFEYNLFMKLFNLEISFSELYNSFNMTRDHYDSNLVESFIWKYSKYAMEKYYIQDFYYFVMSKPFFQECYNNYSKYINKEISFYDYFEQLNKFDINRNSYHTFIMKYLNKIMKVQNVSIASIKQKVLYSRNILDLINSSSDEKEIFTLLTDYGEYKYFGIAKGNSKLHTLKSGVSDYVIVKYRDTISREEQEQIISSLNQKIDKVLSAHKENQKNEKAEIKKEQLNEMFDQSSNLVNEFINSKGSLKDFLNKKNITYTEFEKMIESVKQNDMELYQQYSDSIDNKKAQQYAVIMKKCDNIIYWIKNGIIDENTEKKRDYNMLDYYTYTSLTPDEFIRVVKDNHSKDMRIIRNFFERYKGKNDETDLIRKMKYSINFVEVTDEQKEEVINYLRSINSPINIKLFKLAARKILQDELLNGDKKTR